MSSGLEGASKGERPLYWISSSTLLRRLGSIALLSAATITCGLVGTRSALSQPARTVHDEHAAVRRVLVTLNKSRTFRSGAPFAKAVIGAPEIADVLPMSDEVLYVQGKKVGTTDISLFDAKMRLIGVLDVEVAIDTQNLADKIHSSADGRKIKVSTNNGQVVLSGEVRDGIAADRAMSIAKGMTPDNPVVNAMQVAASQQVLLKVRFLEVSRDAGRDLGVNWYGARGNRGINTGLGSPTQAGQSPTATPGGIPLFQTAGTFVGAGAKSAPFGVALANLAGGATSIDVLITALESKGVVRRLAEPDVVALSGDTASFFAGGEIPVPIAQPSASGVPLVTIDYKPFGVQLTFVPTVLGGGVINLRMAPSVSELDFTNAVQIAGYTVPALTKREARTTIELRDGQSFAIAGLLQSEGLRNIAQIPWLGSVPVLGALFRSASYHQHETDLVVIVTPHLVAPAVPGQPMATPMDQRLPSNDRDFFLLGRTEVPKRYTDYVTAGRDLKGPYGHLIALPPK